MNKYIFKTSIFILCVFLSMGRVAAQFAYDSQFGTKGNGNGQFYAPTAMAIDASGNIYVADAGNDRIQKFNSSGTYITQWGGTGSGNGQFNNPTGVAVDASGNVYVADQNNNRIQKFNSGGTYSTQWGTKGNTAGQFYAPTSVAVDASGNVYVADAGNDRIQKFNSSGTSLAQWGTTGNGNGQFNYPTGVSINASGNIYVMDQNNHRIQILTSAGAYSSQFGSVGNGFGQLYAPSSVSVDAAGNVYISDSGNDRISIFNSGLLQATVGSYGASDGLFNFPTGVVSNSEGTTLYVVDQNNHRIQVFKMAAGLCTTCSNQGYSFANKWGTLGIANGQFKTPSGIAVDKWGNVYVTDYSTGNYPNNPHRVQKFDYNGTFITSWDSYPGGPLCAPQSVAVDESGNVYVADACLNMILKYNSSGSFITSWGGPGNGNSQFDVASCVAVDASGYVFVADAGNHRIQKFNNAGGFVTKWGQPGTGNGEFSNPRSVAVDASGNVYVADNDNYRIQKFNNAGGYIRQWGSMYGTGTGISEFLEPWDIAIDGNGDVYVSDYSREIIQKFNSNGIYITTFGNSGSGDGQFDNQKEIAIDKSCKIYVADQQNYRVQVFAPAVGPTITSFASTLISQGGSTITKVIITGTGFTGTTSVKFNGVPSANFTVNSSTQITAIVPIREHSGSISVISNCISASISGYFVNSACYSNHYSYLSQWGNYGTGPSQFNAPHAIALDLSSNVYVSDIDNNRILKFSSTGSPLYEWTNIQAAAIAFDETGNMYVRTLDNSIMEFNGASLIAQWAGPGDGLSEFNSLAIDGVGNIYVSDGATHSIQKFDKNHNLIDQIVLSPSKTGLITVDGSGNIYATDLSVTTNRLYVYDNSGTLIRSWIVDNSYYEHIYGLAVDGMGNVYLTHKNHILKYDNYGNLLAQWGEPGDGNGQFYSPRGVAVDALCKVYVVDGYNNRVQVFSPLSIARLAADIDSTGNSSVTSGAVQVYPNPNQGEFNIVTPGKTNFDLVLYNSLGEEVLREKNVSGELYTISDHELPQGVYFLNIIRSWKTEKIKIVINK